ncbi:MAG: hypothetical protein IKA65_08535 [Lentisphaeria bacterium]|nr:hypothetical protein [Lentisphaeria bacterium]
MQFAAGYQYRSSGELFSEMVADYTSAIAEVYFAPPGFASGRPDAAQDKADALDQLIYELKALRSMNIKLDMLLNGNCYGDNAIAVAFRNRIVEMLEWFAAENLLPEVITTASPFVAHTIKKYFCNIEVRASVNMRIDSLTALEYLQEKFDSFYLRRDLQRDIPTVAMFARWSKLHGKKLCLLANSGCLRNCPYQTFHDNLVAHDRGLRRQENVQDFMPHLCWDRYHGGNNMEDFLRSNWIRPEDVKRYEPYCSLMKLATRQHSNPRLVFGAYCSGNFDGNVLDLTEPCFSGAFAPLILDNRMLDGVELPGKCATNCKHCGKCQEIIKKAAHSLVDK